MKILQILEATLGGTARHVIDLAGGLARRGHEVHLLYSPARVDGIFRQGLDTLLKSGVRTVPIEMLREIGIHDLKAWVAIRSYIRKTGPFAVVHGHSSKGGALARLCGLGLSGVRVYTPNAFVTANPELKGPLRAVYGLSETILGFFGHGVIAVSQEEYDQGLELGIPRRKMYLVPNGAELGLVQGPGLSRADLGLDPNAVILGFVGRLVQQKAPENLMRAFAIVAPRFPNVRLAVVGSGPLEGMAREEALRLGIADRVDWLGVRSGPAVMKAFDAFVLPSRYEGLPYVLIEALGAGLPIVTTRIGGVGVLVEEGINGYTVPHSRPDLLADGMAALAADPALRARMGAASLAKSPYFSADRMVEDNLSVYAGLLGRVLE
jgi:glycosyltransferase involved in cell wall biosynthesis